MSTNLPKAYDPSDVEGAIYQMWEKSGYFNPDNLEDSKGSFTISMPPPNATGTLHLGHSVMLALQDLMIRYHRMKGDKTLWVPGTDHASIATQNKVEKILASQGISRHDLGREKFLEKVQEYVSSSRETIRGQIRKMGSSCDWSRERYTLDEGLYEAVKEIFVKMYEDGLIYRGNRIVNWCPRCTSTLADDEVKHKDLDSKLYYVKYQIKNSNEFLIVATTRPETMFGDVALAVNPADERYSKYIGQVAIMPLGNHEITIIADEYVDKSFGTGVLKITPAHDPNDAVLGQKYKLKNLKIMNETGQIDLEVLRDELIDLESIKEFNGLDRFEAREKVVEYLGRKGFIEKIENHQNAVGFCYRCDTIIEPMTSRQWFVSVDRQIERYQKSLKQMAIDAVQKHDIEFIPSRFEKIYFNWMNNLRDWCISRQIWFGHQIPAYYCNLEDGGCGEVIVAKDRPAKCSKCGNQKIVQDQDTLDTWFSSGLWTFSTLGWPENAKYDKAGNLVKTSGDLAQFHPTAVLETAYDIIFFWVARMILMTEYALGCQPFKHVYIHGLVLDDEGKKMSKSNEAKTIDPLKMISDFGTDALRLSMVVGISAGNDFTLQSEKIAGYRNFVNKLFNICRYILEFGLSGGVDKKIKPTLADQWILSRLNQTIKNVTSLIDKFDFSAAADVLRKFSWDDLADWYLEIAKVEKNKDLILTEILEKILILWHPFAPFVTEHIYQSAKDNFGKKTADLLMIKSWPSAELKKIDQKMESNFELIKDCITTIRNIRTERKIAASQKIQAVLYSPYKSAILQENSEIIKKLARIDILTIMDSGTKPANAISATLPEVEIFLPLGLSDLTAEREKNEKELVKIKELINNLSARLSNKEFTDKAPKNIIEKEHQKLADYQSAMAKLQEQIAKMG